MLAWIYLCAVLMCVADHLPGAIAFDNLPPGTTILAHSACLHGRRARPGPGPRYFVSQPASLLRHLQ